MRLPGIALAALIVATTAHADIAEELARCAELTSSDARLACYDQLNKADGTAAEKAAIPVEASPSAIETPAVTAPAIPAAVAAPAGRTLPPQSTASPVELQAPPDLEASDAPRAGDSDDPVTRQDSDPSAEGGVLPASTLPEQKSVAPQTASGADSTPIDPSADVLSRREAFGGQQFVHGKSESLKEITAVVVNVQKLSRGTFQLTMADGQVWREVEHSQRTRYEVGDEVVIVRGFMGTYTLESKTTGRHNKVTRIE